MNHHDRGGLKFLFLFSIVFAASSFFFSLLSWGHARLEPRPEMLQYVSGGLVDLVEHAALGALVALPTRKKLAIVVCALAAMLIDVDHIGFMVGLPTQGRASHGVPFAVAVFLCDLLACPQRDLWTTNPASGLGISCFGLRCSPSGMGCNRRRCGFSSVDALVE